MCFTPECDFVQAVFFMKAQIDSFHISPTEYMIPEVVPRLCLSWIDKKLPELQGFAKS